MFQRPDPQPQQHQYFLPTVEMRNNLAHLYERLGYKYIIGWYDVSGWALWVIRNVEWIQPHQRAYIHL